MPRNTHQHSQQRRYYIDVFPEDLQEAAEMLAEKVTQALQGNSIEKRKLVY